MLGQLTNAWHHWANGSNVLGQAFNYGFDDIGNREYTQTGGDAAGANLRTANYYPNLLNQYTNRTVTGYIEASGSAPTNVVLNVNGSGAERQGGYFRRELSIDNSTGATSVWVNAVGTNATATNLVARFEQVPQTPESFTYDADGNLTTDGLRSYVWDAENRLISIEIRTNVITDSALWQRTTSDYDYQHRRVRKQVYSWNPDAGEYHLRSSLRFFYDGWNLIGQLDEVTGVRLSFLWGADMSGSLYDTGGVGGLKAIVVHNGPLAGAYYPQYDGNGNIIALIDAATQFEAARYEYGPFGELLRVSGAAAEVNPFRFSTKYSDSESNLIYYGFRYYDPTLGRWVSQDPLEEQGGANLYAMLGNDGVNFVDPLGLILFDNSESVLLAYIGRTLDPRAFVENITSGDSFRVASAYSYHVLKAPVDLVEGLYHLPDFLRSIPELAELVRSGQLKCLLGAKWDEFWRASPEEQMEILGGLTGTAAGGWATGVGSANLIKALRAARAAKLRPTQLEFDFAKGDLSGKLTRWNSTDREFQLFRRHRDVPRPRPVGTQSHHGVNSVWVENNYLGYLLDDAPTILMRNAPNHNATRGVFNRLRAEFAHRQGVASGDIDWSKVSPGESWRLAEEMMEAAKVPAGMRDDYFKMFNEYLETLRPR